MSPVWRRHWTPRYVVDRVRLRWHERRHPDHPWLTSDAIAHLETWLRPTHHGLEWGSGRSTAWFAPRVASVYSIEHDATWAARVRESVSDRLSARVQTVDADDVESYVNPPGAPDRVDFALIDGIHRSRCALRALEIVVDGGVVIIDNAERYLPTTSHGPEAIGDAYASDEWKQFADTVQNWRRLWTSNGVTDTALYFRPASAPTAVDD